MFQVQAFELRLKPLCELVLSLVRPSKVWWSSKHVYTVWQSTFAIVGKNIRQWALLLRRCRIKGELYSRGECSNEDQGCFNLPILREKDLCITLTFLHLLKAVHLFIAYCHMLVVSSHRVLTMFHQYARLLLAPHDIQSAHSCYLIHLVYLVCLSRSSVL